MNKVLLVSNMLVLRNEIRIALYKLAHSHSGNLEQYISQDRLPPSVWTFHEEFAVLHEEYVALKQGIIALA
jgi:hypothetical protein